MDFGIAAKLKKCKINSRSKMLYYLESDSVSALTFIMVLLQHKCNHDQDMVRISLYTGGEGNISLLLVPAKLNQLSHVVMLI